MIEFEKAERQKAKLRMAITGVSGAGKTLSSLYIAYGITDDWNKIALIDTEHERARFYSEREDLETGQFLYTPFYPPYNPQKYIEAVKEGSKLVGSDGVIIIDSLSHAWNGEGGVLDMKNSVKMKNPKQNDFVAWNELSKYQNQLINTLMSVDCHLIVTMRSKMQYALQLDERGRQVPVKLGLGAIQREDTEYEFDIVLDISRDHIATASKDVTFLNEYGEIITPDLGRQLSEWLNSGKEVPKEICEECGEVISSSDGFTVKQIIEVSKKRYNKKLCIECCRKSKNKINNKEKVTGNE